MLITLNNCCTKSYLDSMMLLSQKSDKWNFRYPEGKPFEERFAKINLVPDNQDTSLAGMAMGLLLQSLNLNILNTKNGLKKNHSLLKLIYKKVDYGVVKYLI